jgi:hypothetical protein
MKRRTKYADEPVGTLKVVRDSLPRPDQLVLRDNNVKVTLSLSKASVDFFKAKARANRAPYQKMIRNLLDYYAAQNRTPENRRRATKGQGDRHQA